MGHSGWWQEAAGTHQGSRGSGMGCGVLGEGGVACHSIVSNLRRLALACVLLGGFSSAPVLAQVATNTVTVSPPAGVTDPNCNVALPLCNSATDTDPVLRPVTITKVLTGAPAGGAPGAYGFDLVCASPNATYTGTITLAAGATTGNTTVNVPVGSTGCTLTETSRPTEPAGYVWGAATYTQPPSPIPATGTVEGAITNPLTGLSQTLAKALTGNADEDGSGTVSVGDTLTYTVTLTNTSASGNLTNVTVSDNKITPNTITCPSVAPGATCVLTGTYVVTAADATAGNIVNTATSTSRVCPAGSADPACTTTVTTPVTNLSQTLAKALTGNADEDGSGTVSVGDTLTYTVTLTNTSASGNLTNVTVSDNKITPANITCPSVAPGATCVLTGTYVVTAADATAGNIVNTATATGPLCPAGGAGVCTTTVTTPVTQHPAIATTKTATLTTDNLTQGVGNTGDVITYTVTATNTGDVPLSNIVVTDVLEGGAPTTLTCTPTTLAPGATATCASYTHTITSAEANAGGMLDNAVTASGQGPGGNTQTVTAEAKASVEVEPDPTTVHLVKTAQPRDVKIGDLVRYTLTMENTGEVAVVDATLVDTPPAGFTYVDGTLTVADDDGAGRLVGTYPISVDQIDIAVGGRATITYLLRVGAGVRAGTHTNTAQVLDNGAPVSNIATADVQLVSDPMLDESLIVGTVFDDRDGDGWQDSAAMGGIRVQGGFAPGAYVAGSTTVDRGKGPQPEADASAPLLHGIAIGDIAGRQSDADPAAAHRVVVGQTLSSLDFTDDFVLTTKQGVSLRMDAAGNTSVDRSQGDAARGLSAATPTVERTISQVEGGYRVDYVIGNAGVDERGIPGVRIASVEGLLMETDPFGRYHVIGIDGGRWERGRNFILKVDPATLPPGSTFTTDNPLLRRITPGLPVRFDFGIKLPPGLVEGGHKEVEMQIGEVLFHAESAELREEYLPVIDKMAEQVRAHAGGEVVIAANGETQALAYDRARAVQSALLSRLDPGQAQDLKVSLRTDLDDPDSTLVALGETPVLGTVLFDTDSSAIKPEFEPVIDKVAADIAKLGGGVVGVVGHADQRGSDAYNVALGLRRAKAVYAAIAAKLDPEVRSKLRVEISDDPTAPVGLQGRQGGTP